MSTQPSFVSQIDDLLDSYRSLLKICYDALDEAVKQEQRDLIRKRIEQFVVDSND